MPAATQEAIRNNIGPRGISTGSSTDWAPLPEGRYPRFVVETLNVKEATGQYAKDKAGNQRYRCVYRFGLPIDVAEKVKAKLAPKLEKGQEQSTSVFVTVGYAWGYNDERTNAFKESKLFTLFRDVLGPKASKNLERWLIGGGNADPAWLIGATCKGYVKHSPQSSGNGEWVNLEPASIEELDDANNALLMAQMAEADAALFEYLFGGADVPPKSEGGTEDGLPF